MGAHRVLELPSGFLLVALVVFASCREVRRSWACCNFLSLPVEIVWRVGEVLPFVCLKCLKMDRQGLDFEGSALIHVRQWLRFPSTICMVFFHSMRKTRRCLRLVCVRCDLHKRCGIDND